MSKYSELVGLLEDSGVLQLEDDWAVEIQKLVKGAPRIAAPVPPAGYVEVLEVYGYQCRQSAQEKFFLHEYPHYWQHIPLVRQADAMERITRLTAENDAIRLQAGGMQMTIDELLADVKALTEHREELKMQRDRWVRMHNNLQSELTKARELLKSVRGYVNRCAIGGGRSDRIKLRAVDDFITQQPATPIAHNVDESCGQDAEAAKGGA